MRISVGLRACVSTSLYLLRGLYVDSLTTPRGEDRGLSLHSLQGERSAICRLIGYLLLGLSSTLQAVESSRSNVRGSRVVVSFYRYSCYKA